MRDAPYAVDHLSRRSQRPIISRDTCDSPIKSVTCWLHTPRRAEGEPAPHHHHHHHHHHHRRRRCSAKLDGKTFSLAGAARQSRLAPPSGEHASCLETRLRRIFFISSRLNRPEGKTNLSSAVEAKSKKEKRRKRGDFLARWTHAGDTFFSASFPNRQRSKFRLEKFGRVVAAKCKSLQWLEKTWKRGKCEDCFPPHRGKVATNARIKVAVQRQSIVKRE